MTILGCASTEEAFALHHAESKRAGRRGEFNDHIRSFPVVPAQLLSQEELISLSNPMNEVKMLVHMLMSRPGDKIHNFHKYYEIIKVQFGQITFLMKMTKKRKLPCKQKLHWQNILFQ